MGIIKISEELHEAAKLMARAMSRSVNSQAEYWMRLGRALEDNPSFNYQQVVKNLIDQATREATDDVGEDV